MNCLITSTGTVTFVPELLLTASCRMDVSWFPFDTQTCSPKFGSWTHSGNELDLSVGLILISEYIENGEWSLLGLNASRLVKFYECCPEMPFIEIHFTFILKWRLRYYFFNLIIPCGLIGFLSLLGFTIPPDSGEKLTLGVTVLFSLIVFLNTIAETMPANSDRIPLLGTYFNSVMFLIASSVVSTIMFNSYRRAFPPKRRLTGLARGILLEWIPRMLWLGQQAPFGTVKTREGMWTRVIGASLPPPSKGNGNEIWNVSNVEMGKCKETVIVEEWKYASVVLDKFCLVISILFVLISVLFFLVSGR